MAVVVIFYFIAYIATVRHEFSYNLALFFSGHPFFSVRSLQRALKRALHHHCSSWIAWAYGGVCSLILYQTKLRCTVGHLQEFIVNRNKIRCLWVAPHEGPPFWWFATFFLEQNDEFLYWKGRVDFCLLPLKSSESVNAFCFQFLFMCNM
jgi:hypothetical protein